MVREEYRENNVTYTGMHSQLAIATHEQDPRVWIINSLKTWTRYSQKKSSCVLGIVKNGMENK